RLRARLDPAAMRLDDRLADRQADAEPRRLGAVEGPEHGVDGLRFEARSGILDRNLDGLRRDRDGRNGDPTFSGTGHRLDRVPDEVDQYLLDLDRIDLHPLGVTIEPELNLHAVALRIRKHQHAGLGDDRRKVLGVRLDLPLGDKGTQSLQDLAGALDRIAGDIERASRLSQLRGRQRAQHLSGRRDRIAGRRERLCQLMGERRRHRPHRAQLRGMHELGLGALQILFRTLLVGDVAIEDGEAALSRMYPDLEPGLAPVGPIMQVLGGNRHALAHRTGQQLLQPGIPDLWCEFPKTGADEVRTRPLRHLETHLVDLDNAKLPVDEDEAFADELQKLASGTATWHDPSGTGPELFPQYRHAAKPVALSA